MAIMCVCMSIRFSCANSRSQSSFVACKCDAAGVATVTLGGGRPAGGQVFRPPFSSTQALQHHQLPAARAVHRCLVSMHSELNATFLFASDSSRMMRCCFSVCLCRFL